MCVSLSFFVLGFRHQVWFGQLAASGFPMLLEVSGQAQAQSADHKVAGRVGNAGKQYRLHCGCVHGVSCERMRFVRLRLV